MPEPERKKSESGRTQSAHAGGDGRPLLPREIKHHQAIHNAQMAANVAIARWKWIGLSVIAVCGAIGSYATDPPDPEGAPGWVMLVLGGSLAANFFLVLLWRAERKLRSDMIERFSPIVSGVEKALDPNRSSSRLTPDGETPEES